MDRCELNTSNSKWIEVWYNVFPKAIVVCMETINTNIENRRNSLHEPDVNTGFINYGTWQVKLRSDLTIKKEVFELTRNSLCKNACENILSHRRVSYLIYHLMQKCEHKNEVWKTKVRSITTQCTNSFKIIFRKSWICNTTFSEVQVPISSIHLKVFKYFHYIQKFGI